MPLTGATEIHTVFQYQTVRNVTRQEASIFLVTVTIFERHSLARLLARLTAKFNKTLLGTSLRDKNSNETNKSITILGYGFLSG